MVREYNNVMDQMTRVLLSFNLNLHFYVNSQKPFRGNRTCKLHINFIQKIKALSRLVKHVNEALAHWQAK